MQLPAWLALLTLDRGTKYFFFDQSVLNTKSVFSLSWISFVAYPILFLLLFLLIFFLLQSLAFPVRFFGLSIIFLGAISNLFDRIIYGGVIDFIFFGPWVMNVADILIVSGIFISFLPKRKI